MVKLTPDAQSHQVVRGACCKASCSLLKRAKCHNAYTISGLLSADNSQSDNLTISATDPKYLEPNNTRAAILSGLPTSESIYQPAFNCSVSIWGPIVQAALRALPCRSLGGPRQNTMIHNRPLSQLFVSRTMSKPAAGQGTSWVLCRQSTQAQQAQLSSL